jgi:hypothetical protein
MIIERLTAGHLREIELHDDQQDARQFWTAEYEQQLLAGDSWAVRHAGQILLCGGVLSLYEDTRIGHVWSLMSRHAGAQFLRLHRIVLRFFRSCGKSTLVATTAASSECGVRWLKALGFAFNHVEPAFDPAGRDHTVYVRAQ